MWHGFHRQPRIPNSARASEEASKDDAFAGERRQEPLPSSAKNDVKARFSPVAPSPLARRLLDLHRRSRRISRSATPATGRPPPAEEMATTAICPELLPRTSSMRGEAPGKPRWRKAHDQNTSTKPGQTHLGPDGPTPSPDHGPTRIAVAWPPPLRRRSPRRRSGRPPPPCPPLTAEARPPPPRHQGFARRRQGRRRREESA